MRHPEIKMSLEGLQSPLDSVQNWLHQELEQRGIDAHVYARYIISVLRDGLEPEGSECEDFWDHKRKAARDKKVKQRRPASQGQDDPRKCAVVDLLLSLCDSKADIRNLVDELSKKLNNNSEGAVYAPLHVELKREKEAQSADPAEQYYAAFPPLKVETTPTVSPSGEGDNIWRRKPLASQLAGETLEKHDNGIGSEAVDTPSGKQGSSENHSARRAQPSSSDRRGLEPKPCKNGKKKISPPGKKRSRKDIPVSARTSRTLSWPSEGAAPQSTVGNFSSIEFEGVRDETCMQIEGMLKNMLFRKVATYQSLELNVGRQRQNPSPEFKENNQWYVKPWQDIEITPSLPTQRLYKRNSFPPPFLSLRDTHGCKMVPGLDALFNSPTPADTHALLEITAFMNYSPSQPSILPDYDSGKDSAVVSDGDLSSGEEDHSKEKTPSIEICFAAHLVQSRRDDIAKSLSSSLEVSGPQHDEDDSSREPSLGSQEEETIFHLELDENETTSALNSIKEDPVNSTSVSEPRVNNLDVWEAYFGSQARTVGQDLFQKELQHSAAHLHEDPCHIPETGKDSAYSSELLQSQAEEPESHNTDVIIEDAVVENQPKTPAQDGILSPAVFLPAYLRNALISGEKSAKDGNGAPGAFLPAYLWNALIDGEKFPEDATSFCPTSSLLPNKDWSVWSEAPLGLGLFSTSSRRPTHRPHSRSRIEPAFHGCLHFSGLPSLEFDAQSPPSSVFWDLFSLEVGMSKAEPAGEASTPFSLFSYLPSDWSPWATTSQDWDLSTYAHKPWPCPAPSHGIQAWNDRSAHQSFSPGILCMIDSTHVKWDAGAGGDPATQHGSEKAKGSIWSPSMEKTHWHVWDVNLSRKAPLGWSIWSNHGNEQPLMMPPYNESEQDSKFSSSTQSPDAEDPVKPDAENAGPSYSLFPKIPKFGGVSVSDWPSMFRYDRSASEGDLHCYQEVASVNNHGNGRSDSYELIPSENSAFRPYLQGNKALLHVRSTPNMKFSFSDKKKDHESSELDFPGEHPFISSRTHFRPIQTPLSTPEDELEFRPSDLFGGYTSRDSQYQRYRDPEEPANPMDEFQPKFKLQKDHDKYIQTSLDDKEETLSAVTVATSGTYHDPFSSRERPGNSIDAFHESGSLMGLSLGEQTTQACLEPKEVPAEPWMDNGNVQQGSWGDPAQAAPIGYFWQPKPQDKVTGDGFNLNYHSIWSVGLDHNPDLPTSSGTSALPSAPPLLSVNCTQSLSEPLAPVQLSLEDEVFYPSSISCSQEASEPQNHSSEPMQKDDYCGYLAPIPDQAVYSSDLERQWRSETCEARQTRNLSRTKSAKTSTINKPCSYYIEGRCRRSECKFSHDLSTITCCFWLENKCFKGSLCPFLHAFASDVETTSPPQHHATVVSPEFSELDFPTLGRNDSVVQQERKITA